MWNRDPGPCPICGAAHTACTGDSGAITVAQLPARDAAAPPRPAISKPPASLKPGEVTTATYRGTGRRRR